MATSGTAYFDAKGAYFKTPTDATISDLAAILGKVGNGDGDGLAPGIAKTLLDKRAEIEAIFAEHDKMIAARPALKAVTS